MTGSKVSIGLVNLIKSIKEWVISTVDHIDEIAFHEASPVPVRCHFLSY